MVKWNNERLIAAILGIMLSLSVFSEGMYREGSRYIFWIFTVAVFVYSVFKLKIDIMPKSSADIFIIAAVAVYVLCTFTAVSLWDSLSNVFRYTGIYLFCLTAKCTVKNNLNWFAFPFYFISSAAAFWGIFESLNILKVTGAYDTSKGLLLSVFHYHNASAVYFSCVFILGIYLASAVRGKIIRAVVFGCNTVILSTVLYTQSRGGWLTLAVGMVLFLIMNRKTTVFSKYIFSVMASGISVAAVMSGFMDAFSARTDSFVCEKPIACIAFTVLGFFIAFLLSFLSDAGVVKRAITPKRVAFLLPVVIIVFAAAFLLLLPDELVNRITEFSVSSSTVSERLIFFKDSFKIFIQHPFLGIGGDGWQYVYPSIQTQFYTVAHPHSYFAEMMTDAGIFGIALYVFLIFTFVFGFIKREKNAESSVLCAVSFMIILHTLFDFDTDYYSLQTLLFVCLSIAVPDYSQREKYSKLITVIPALLVLWSAFNGVAYLNYNYAVDNATANNADEIYTYTKRAAILMPVKVDYLTTHANVTLGRSKGEQKYMYEAEKCLNRAYKLNKYNYETITQMAIYKIRCKDYEGAADEIDKLVDIQPFITETYNRIKAVYYDYIIVPLSGKATDEDLPLLKNMCQRFTDSVNRAYPISEKCDARIEIHTDVRDAQQVAESIVKQLDDMGV